MSEAWMSWKKRLSPEAQGVLNLAMDVKNNRYPNTPIIGINYLRAVAEMAEVMTDEMRRVQDPNYWERRAKQDAQVEAVTKGSEDTFTL